MDAYPHLSQTITDGVLRYRFEQRTTLPPARLISNVNIVPFVGERCLMVRFAGEDWEIPGGTLEPSETLHMALRRELREEAGAVLRSFEVFGALHYHSSAPKPFRPHIPHPEFYRVVGFGQVEVVDLPQPGLHSEDQRVLEIAIVPVDEAVRRFRAQGKDLHAELYALADYHRRRQEAQPMSHTDRIMLFDTETQRNLVQYIRATFAPEDDALQAVIRNTPAHGLPEIQIRPEEGQILQFLVALTGARRVLEIGTLAGYSGIWLARGLLPGGELVTLERDPHHTHVAREHFELAGVAEQVRIIEGDAHATLQKLDGGPPFDLVFIDAEKDGYPAYLEWAVRNVRSGGLITAHNAFRGGALVTAPDDAATIAMRAFLSAMAAHEALMSTILPVGDGIAAAVVR